jgi:ABC-type branched-subunit amino acid transport system substrate-binding protein
MRPGRFGRLSFFVVVVGVIVAVAASAAFSGGSADKQLVIGMINQENTPAGSFPQMSQSERAAVAYVNNELMKGSGYQLKLDVCTTVGTPESSGACANRLIEQKPIAVSIGIDFGTVASVPALTKAGIPMVGGVPLLPPEYGSTNAYFFTAGSAGAFPAQDRYIALNKKDKKVNIIYTDNAAGLAAAGVFGKNILVKLGLNPDDIKLVPEAADAADFTPSVTAAAANHPDAIMVLFAAQGCSRVMQAKQALGITGIDFWYPGSCADQAVIKAGGAGAQDAYFNSETLLYNDTSDKDVRTYLTKLKQYGGKNAVVSNFSQSAFQSVMDIYQLFKEIGYSKVTSQSLVTKLKTVRNHTNFMAYPYSCNGKRTPFPSVCNAHNRIVQYKDGAYHDVLNGWITGGPLIKLG